MLAKLFRATSMLDLSHATGITVREAISKPTSSSAGQSSTVSEPNRRRCHGKVTLSMLFW